MGLSSLNQLYKSVVMDHAGHPRNFGTLEDSTDSLVLRNPSCGDIINVQVKVENNKVDAIKFKGSGCTISMASTSMMTDVIKGKTIEQSNQIIKMFFDNIVNKTVDVNASEQLGDALVLSTVAKFPTRIRCATLGWHALDDLLNNNKEVNE